LNSLCKYGNIYANFYPNITQQKTPKKADIKTVNLKVKKSLEGNKKENYKLEGAIPDIGFIAEALNISKLIRGGDFKVNITQNIVDNKLVLDGEVKSTSDIDIYDNEIVKKLAKDDLFSQVQDKIFSDEKTTFGSVIIDFSLQGEELIIKSLIVNNFKIGITAKGRINLKNNAISIKGMIIPGYIINSLFGLSKIPILGNVISGLTGGDGGGLFSMRYEYNRKAGAKEGEFVTNKVSAFVPSSISVLFE
jgi:hypothetical protein